MKYDCLIIDDELEISQTICEYFNMFDVSSAYVTSFDEGVAFLEQNNVSLLLLDVNLGEQSGFSFCKQVRKTSGIPIVFISARNAEQDILSGLMIGGDDYITKPFSMNILLAKVKAILKRSSLQKEQADVLTCGNLRIERASSRVYKKDSIVKLKPMEWRLLQYLLDNQGRVITKDELLSKVWETQFVNEGTLSVHIRHLREKLEENPDSPQIIKTVWGTGYLCELNDGGDT